MAPVILSADDDDDAQLLLRRAFGIAGITADLKQVNDGTEVLAYLEGRGHFSDRSQCPAPALLLLDLKMPQLSGFEVLKCLRENRELRMFPIVIFSSSDNPQDLEKAFSLGADGYLQKPCDFNNLVNLVKTLIHDFIEPGAKRRTVVTSQTSVTSWNSPLAVPEKKGQNGPSITKLSNLAESPEMFHLMVEQVIDYAIFLIDMDGIIRSWNKGARRINGYEAL
jgi:CheY-like chemotaxis protein